MASETLAEPHKSPAALWEKWVGSEPVNQGFALAKQGQVPTVTLVKGHTHQETDTAS